MEVFKTDCQQMVASLDLRGKDGLPWRITLERLELMNRIIINPYVNPATGFDFKLQLLIIAGRDLTSGKSRFQCGAMAKIRKIHLVRFSAEIDLLEWTVRQANCSVSDDCAQSLSAGQIARGDPSIDELIIDPVRHCRGFAGEIGLLNRSESPNRLALANLPVVDQRNGFGGGRIGAQFGLP